MIKVTKQIKVKNAQEIYNKYNVSDKDIEYIKQLIEDEGPEYALSFFINKYMIKPVEEYNILMTEFLGLAEEGELSVEDKKTTEKNISLLTFTLSNILIYNFTKLAEEIYAISLFEEYKIKTKKVQKTILDATLGQFNSLTSKTLTSTQTDILKNVRNMQKEMVIFNQGKGKFLKGENLSKEIGVFKDSLRKRHPEYFKLKEGRLIASKPYGPKNTIRYYKLEDYIEMSARTTLLNIDRTTAQINVLNKEINRTKTRGFPVNVVEYYLKDDRPLKTGIEREICKDVLSTRKYGKPLLALDDETAKILGIRTLDEIMTLGGLGVYCRHSVRPISISLRKVLEKIIKEYKIGTE